ncbi:hypothetical protein BG000_002288 [Podila horticola]|nr:hypothetical protein BG000_002288 [Podila horticola]
MLKKLGINTKDVDNTPPSSSSPTSPGFTRSMGVSDKDKEKRKVAHNKKVLSSSNSFDSMDSPSLAPRPHLPSSVYSPNPFPLDPTQPDGVSRINQFVRKEHEIETIDVDIEIEETRGFMTGKEKGRPGNSRDVEEDVEYELASKGNAMQKFGAGLKGAFAKTGLGKSKEDKDDTDPQHQKQQQQQQRRQSLELESASRQMAARGRPRERTRTQSGSGNDPFSDPRSQRLQSLSPPPLPGQEHRHSGYWPEGEQSRPFLGYQPPSSSAHPPLSSSSQARATGRYPRPTSQHSDSDYSDYARQAIDSSRRYRSRERDLDNRRDGPSGRGGRSGLNHVTNAASVGRTSSEYDDEERSALSSGGGGGDRRQGGAPDRLSRAKDWVASHSKNNSLANPDVRERGGAGSGLDGSPSTPGAFPIASQSRPNRRLSMDSDDYALITPPRGSYLSGAGGGYDSRERMAMLTQMQMQGLQRNRNSMDDGGYWSHQLDGYGRDRDRDRDRDQRYRNSRPQDYEYDPYQGPGPGGFYGYQPGGPDDGEEDAESTLAPGSAAGAPGKAKKGGDKKTEAQGASASDGDAHKDEEVAVDTTSKVPNKQRLALRLISLGSSFLVLVFLIAAAPVSKMSAPWESKAGLATHYIVAILSTLVSCAFVFNYFSRRLRRREKMKRYVMFGLDIFMTLAWMIDVFVCISKFPCAVGGQGGW